MRNPLTKRLPRELKSDFGKYIVIFLFMIMLISCVSGFLVSDNSMVTCLENSYTLQNIEHGHITFDKEPDAELLENIEKEADIKLYELNYFEETILEDKNIRVYAEREEVNKVSLMEGKMPENENEIAIDRMFADNNEIKVGDTFRMKDKTLTVSGFVSLSDYTSLFEKNTDTMLNALTFSVGIMTRDGFDSINSSNMFYNYAWKYNCDYDHNDKVRANELSEELIDNLGTAITEYDEKVAMNGEFDKIIGVENYLPQYVNQAIIYALTDLGGDRGFFIIFAYLVIAVLAFIFAVTTSNTLAKEAGVIGTLRSSGYSRGELTFHYLILPIAVTLISAVVGNIIGYSYFKGIIDNLYYGTYSLPYCETLWNADAFILTTVVPLVLMFIINFIVIANKMKLTPLQFLRRELKSNPKKRLSS